MLKTEVMNQGVLPLLEKSRESIKLPSLSGNINLLIEALADDDISYRQLAEVINHYPEVTARLIFLANSAWSAPVSPITSIEQACSRLGSSVIRSVSLALAVFSHFNPARCPEFNKVHFWTTSMLVAEGARLLASGMPKYQRYADFQQSGQTAGLLHNLGLLWLAEHFPKETGTALRMVLAEDSLTVSEALHQCMGADYCIVGGWIGEQWKIPEILAASMKYHLESHYTEQFWEMVLIVRSAAGMVAALHKNREEAPVNARLAEALGIDPSSQRQVFKTLLSKLEKTRELAGVLFT